MNKNADTLKKIQTTIERMARNITLEKLTMLRNTSFAGAGSSIVFLFVLTALEVGSFFSSIALFCICVAIPFQVSNAIITESYIWFWPESKNKASEYISSTICYIIGNIGYIALGLGVMFCIIHLNVYAGIVFVASSILCIVLTNKMQKKLLTSLEDPE